ncbi:MAG: MvaI/BcnI family restriction endonuclease [Planctomycetaceae bacterium]
MTQRGLAGWNSAGRSGTAAFVLMVLAFVSVSARCGVKAEEPDSPALAEFLRRFDPITERGYVKTLRPGSTGVGYTLESLLRIEENNSPAGDLLGMEIKAYRDDEQRFDDHEKMNLFLKEPEWLDEMSSAERIRAYGYVDNNGRLAWYQSVTSRPNDAGLRLAVDKVHSRVVLQREDRDIAFWTFDVLQQRLQEKHSEAVFVAAATRGKGADEEFHYRAVTYCARPAVDRLLSLIDEGDVILELRMHIRPTGGARNHGTAFRVRKHRLVDLFAFQQRCRPIDGRKPGNGE